MVQRPLVFAIAKTEGAAVVKAQIPFIICVLGEIYAFLGKDLSEQFKMNRLIVDYDTVEIKDDGAQHRSNLQESSFVSTRSALEKHLWQQIIMRPITTP